MAESNSGIKVPLIVDGAMLVLVIFMAGGQWYKTDALADDVAEIKAKDLPERTVRIEEQVKANARAIDRANATGEKNQDLLREILSKTPNGD